MSYSTKIPQPTALDQTLMTVSSTFYTVAPAPATAQITGSAGDVLYNNNGQVDLAPTVANDDGVQSLASNGIISGIVPTKTMTITEIELSLGKARVNGKIVDFAGTALSIPSTNTNELLYIVLDDNATASISTTPPTAQQILITALIADGSSLKHLLYGGQNLDQGRANFDLVTQEIGLVSNGFGFSFGADKFNSFGGVLTGLGRSFVLPKKEGVALDIFDDSSYLRELSTLTVDDFKFFKPVSGSEQAISGSAYVIWYVFANVGPGDVFSLVLPQITYTTKPTFSDVLLGFANSTFPKLINGFAPVAALIVAGNITALTDIEIHPLARKRAGVANRATILLPRADELTGDPNTAVLGIRNGQYEWRQSINQLPSDSDGVIATNNGLLFTRHFSGAVASGDYYYAVSGKIPITDPRNGGGLGNIVETNIPSLDKTKTTYYSFLSGLPSRGSLEVTNRYVGFATDYASPVFYFKQSLDPHLGTKNAQYVLEVEFFFKYQNISSSQPYTITNFFQKIILKAQKKNSQQIPLDEPLFNHFYGVYSYDNGSNNAVFTSDLRGIQPSTASKIAAASTFTIARNYSVNELEHSSINIQGNNVSMDFLKANILNGYCIYRFYKR